MSASPTPAPSQTVKGIDQDGDRKNINVYNDKATYDQANDIVALNIDNLEFQSLMKQILYEITLVRKHLEIITGEKITQQEIE